MRAGKLTCTISGIPGRPHGNGIGDGIGYQGKVARDPKF